MSSIDFIPRRSSRIASRPPVTYYNDDELAVTIDEICTKFGYQYDDNLVTEFNTWLSTANTSITQKCTYNYSNSDYIYTPRNIQDLIAIWINKYATSLKEQQIQLRYHRAILSCCNRFGVEYDPIMDIKFAQWFQDPANKSLITDTITSTIYCNTCARSLSSSFTNCTQCVQHISYHNKAHFVCVRIWFFTLNKLVILENH